MKQGEAANFAFIEPTKALRVEEFPVGDWLYELKFDGYRALAFKAGKEVRFISRDRIVPIALTRKFLPRVSKQKYTLGRCLQGPFYPCSIFPCYARGRNRYR
jgi:ATP-dependent DNA ligase